MDSAKVVADERPIMAIPPTFEYLAALVALLGIGAAALNAVEGISSASLLRGLEKILCREFERLTYYEEVRLQASEAINRVDGLSTSREAGDSPYISSRAGWVMDINLKALQGIAQTNGPITIEAVPYTWIGPPRPLPLCFVKPGFEDHGRISSAFYFLKRDHQFYLKGYNVLNKFHTAVRTAIVAGDMASWETKSSWRGRTYSWTTSWMRMERVISGSLGPAQTQLILVHFRMLSNAVMELIGERKEG
ncbi:MAG: hypothetical protein ACYC9Q_08430 [Bacillota bacterium]